MAVVQKMQALSAGGAAPPPPARTSRGGSDYAAPVPVSGSGAPVKPVRDETYYSMPPLPPPRQSQQNTLVRAQINDDYEVPISGGGSEYASQGAKGNGGYEVPVAGGQYGKPPPKPAMPVDKQATLPPPTPPMPTDKQNTLVQRKPLFPDKKVCPICGDVPKNKVGSGPH